MTTAILFIAYDGVLEPLGQSQVVRYLARLTHRHRIFLLSFEKAADWRDIARREQARDQLRAAGITWIPLRYHKRPSAAATAFDIAQGIVVGAWTIIRHRVRIVHGRSYVPSTIALTLKTFLGSRFVFDMRGFWADERVDGGLWPRGGRLYRVAKWFERRFLLNADCVVSLTQTAVDEMRTFPYLQAHMPRFEVITTCADLELFRPAEREPSSSPFTLGYVGSVGIWYLFDETLRCFQWLRERVPDARMRIINRGGHAHIQERIAALGIDPSLVQVEAADHLGVAAAMQEMDAGIFFYTPAYSMKATAPTKLGEFLGCGVPCLSNRGVGDMARILESENVGIAVEDFSEHTLRAAVERLLVLARTPDIRARCRDAAQRHFSLEEGAASFDRIYRSLTNGET